MHLAFKNNDLNMISLLLQFDGSLNVINDEGMSFDK